MSQHGRDNRDSKLVWLTAQGWTPAAIAKQLGCSARTVRRRAARPEIKRQIDELRRQWFEKAALRFQRGSLKAVLKLESLMDSPNDLAALGAAKAYLDFGLRYRESLEFAARLEAVERRLNDQNEGANLGEVGATSDDDQPGEDPSGSGAMGG